MAEFMHLLSIEEIQQFAHMTEEERLQQISVWRTAGINPNTPPMAAAPVANDAVRAPGPVPVSIHALDPALASGGAYATASEVADLKAKVASLEEKAKKKRPRRRRAQESGDESDDEDSDGSSKRSKGGGTSNKVLNRKSEELTDKQIAARKALKVRNPPNLTICTTKIHQKNVKEQMESLTGIKTSTSKHPPTHFYNDSQYR